jgi:hypothetical protein
MSLGLKGRPHRAPRSARGEALRPPIGVAGVFFPKPQKEDTKCQRVRGLCRWRKGPMERDLRRSLFVCGSRIGFR